MEPVTTSILERSSEPSIRYWFLTGIRGLPENDAEVMAARQQVQTGERVSKMLEGRGQDGKFPWHAYAKWRGAFWTLLQLVDLGYPAGDLTLKPLHDQVMDWLLDADRLKRIPMIDGRYRRCALQESSAVLTSLKLELPDERIEQLVDLLLKWQWPDGGWNCDKKPEASHSSFYETWIPLRAMNAYARTSGDPRAAASVDRAAEVFLTRRLFKRLSNGEVMLHGFTELAYPTYWHYDILAGLQVMGEIGRLSDPRCKDALDLLESKQLPGGGFAAQVKYYRITDRKATGVTNVNWGPVSKIRMNEFVTARALSVLHQAGRY